MLRSDNKKVFINRLNLDFYFNAILYVEKQKNI